MPEPTSWRETQWKAQQRDWLVEELYRIIGDWELAARKTTPASSPPDSPAAVTDALLTQISRTCVGNCAQRLKGLLNLMNI